MKEKRQKNATDQNEASKKAGLKKKIIYFFRVCTAGVSSSAGWCLINCDASLSDINLGQEWKGTPKYQTETDDGQPTGNGNAFEDVFFRKMKKYGHSVEKVKEEKNGVDFIVDGKPCQLKFGSSPKAVFNKLFEDGDFRYENQTIITNKENEYELRKLIAENSNRFKGDLPEVNPIEFESCDRKETYAQYKKGFQSMLLDLRDILTDPTSVVHLGSWMALAGLVVIAGGCCKEYYNNNRKQNICGNETSKIDVMKKSISDGWKKNWKWALAVGVTMGIGGLCGQLAHRQSLRPEIV